jgi:hypothetical protein
MTVDFANNPPTLYLGTDYGVYYSTNEGTNWSKYGADLPNIAIYEIGCDTANTLLVAATHGRGMWRTQLISGINEEKPTRTSFLNNMKILSNPVVGNKFMISLNVVKPGNFSFVLFDISGKRVCTYLDRQLPVGTHQLTFHVDKLSSGTYFLKTKDKLVNNILKLVIMK